MTTTQEQLAFIKSRCIAANESILDLKFGCEIYNSEYGKAVIKEVMGTGNGSTVKYFSGRNHCFYSDNIKNGKLYRNGSSFSGKEEYWENIGRPIRLADILYAIHKSNIVFGARIENGHMKMMSFGEDFNFPKDSALYNLLNDTIDNQSPELIALVANILAINEE